MYKHTSPKIVDPSRLYQLVCYTILIEAVGGYVPTLRRATTTACLAFCLSIAELLQQYFNLIGNWPSGLCTVYCTQAIHWLGGGKNKHNKQRWQCSAVGISSH